MNVYFYIDELNRDAITASKLKKRLENKGHKIVYGSRTTIKFLKYFHYLFDVIIITRPGLLTLHFQESPMERKDCYIINRECGNYLRRSCLNVKNIT